MYVYCKVDDTTDYKILIPNVALYDVTVHGYHFFINETACELLHRVITSYLTHGELSNDKIQEIEIVFISVLKDMTFSHYMIQPKSMLWRKILRRFFEVKGQVLMISKKNWLPDFLCAI